MIDPNAWVAIGSSIALVYAGLSTRRIWNRRKTYYRLYRSMIDVYERYSNDPTRFNQEVESLSKTITKCFIEDKINDDQLDKLLTRRDDLTERILQDEK